MHLPLISPRTFHIQALLLALALWLLPWGLSAQPGDAAFVTVQGYPQQEVVVVRFLPTDSEFVPRVQREGDQRVRISAPLASWGDMDVAENLEIDALELLGTIEKLPQSLILHTRTDAFGYVSQFDAGISELVVTLFPDPLGKRWPAQPVPEVVMTPPEPVQDSLAPTTEDGPENAEPPDSPAESITARNQIAPTRDVEQNLDQLKQTESPSPKPQDRQQRVITPRQRETSPTSSAQGMQEVPETEQQRTPIAAQSVSREPETSPPNTLRASIRRVGPGQAEETKSTVGRTAGTESIPDQRGLMDRFPLQQEEEPITSASVSDLPADAQPQNEIRNRIRPISAEQTIDQDQQQQEVMDGEPAPEDSSRQAGSEQRAPLVRRQVDTAKADPVKDESIATDMASGEAMGNATTRVPLAPDELSDEQIDETDREEAAQAMLEQEAEVAEETDTSEQPTSAEEKYKKLRSTAQAAMMNGEYEVAEDALRILTTHSDVPDKILEEALFDLGDTLFALHQNDLQNNFEPIASAYERAMNLNPKSRRAALAMRNLGVLHLKVNNLPEARAFFNVLRQEYPYDPLVPTTDYYLGNYFFERGDFNQAADHFQVVVEEHPEHDIAQQATIGLVKSLNTLGFDEQAAQIMQFLENRWPRYYVEDPSLLELAGIIALRVNQLESAKQRMLTYYNLQPDSEDADMLLARIGDIYLLTGKTEPARHVFEKTAQEYPDEEGGLIAKMRLVEGGIHDDPSLEDMFYTMRAAEVYSEIISKHPESPLAAVARLKLAIWQIWNKRLEDSMMVVSDFLEDYPDHSLAPKAREVGLEAFSQLVTRNVEDGRFAEILEQWDQNAFLLSLMDEMTIETQLGLALAFWKEGDFDQALQLASPYLNEKTPRQALLPALELVLGVYLEQQLWDRIVELGELRKEIDLPEKQKRELTYALALAEEKLGNAKRAQPLWLGLADDLGLSEAQRGYALYYLARTAMEDKDWEKVYLYAQEALSLLLLDRKDPGKIKDAMSWLTTVTERTGRLQEALAWAMELDQNMDESDPEWAMSRYRLAQLHQRMNNQEQWREVLEDLQENDADGLYGRLAASALQGRSLEDNASRFSR